MQNVPVSRQGGLTLIELVVVISLIAIIAAIAYPALPTDDSQELDVAAVEAHVGVDRGRPVVLDLHPAVAGDEVWFAGHAEVGHAGKVAQDALAAADRAGLRILLLVLLFIRLGHVGSLLGHGQRKC